MSRLIAVASSSAVRCRRLVTSTRLPPVPGSSGRTCSLPAASSRTSSSCWPASRSRHSATRASRPGGICAAATPAVSSRLASASAGSTGRCPAVCPCSGRKICPSGNRAGQPVRGVHRERGLADPGHPADRVDPDHPAGTVRLGQPAPAAAPARSRPVKQAMSRGSVRVAAAADAPGASASPAARTSRRRGPPRAAATNGTCTGPVRPSAPASSRAVSFRAVRLTPRSRSLTDRGLSPAASASSSCVSRASPRSCRNSPAKFSAGCSVNAPSPLRQAPPAACRKAGHDT